MRYLQPCLEFHLILVWFHLPSSKLIDKNMKRGLCGFIFCSYPLCSILLSSSVLGIRPWSASDFSHLPEGVRNCRKYILSLWVWRVTTRPSSCGNVKNGSWMLRVVEIYLSGMVWEEPNTEKEDPKVWKTQRDRNHYHPHRQHCWRLQWPSHSHVSRPCSL